MATFCLTKQTVDEFKRALKSGKLNPFEMAEMTSEQRRVLLQQYVGVHAKDVNALFESKLLLKNQKAGYQSWVKKVAGITPQTKRDLLSRIERMDAVLSPVEEQAFLQDLANARLGLEVTQQEAKTISDLSNKIVDLKEKADDKGMFASEQARIEYGMTKVKIEKYINDLKLQARKITFKEQPIEKLLSIPKGLPGTMKSLAASLDNSFFGRQGIKTLLDVRTSRIWLRGFLKSFVDISKELRGIDAIDLIRADIYSRPNSINGKYDVGNYGLTVLTEEAFPSSFPERIPLFGRLYKASESAYNGGALRLRADLADRLIAKAEKYGINTLDKEQAQGLGSLVQSMTGRGSLGKADILAKEFNVLFFSIKFVKSNFDTLTAHVFDKKVRANPVARKEAAMNLVSMIGTLATIFTLAGMLDDDDDPIVDLDPRSTNFGKLKIFGRWTDITGGMSGLVRLASYMIPTQHEGKWSLWKKSGTGVWTDMRAGKFGVDDAIDTLIDGLVLNKLSPVAGLFRDAYRNEFFGGEKFTPQGAVVRSVKPIIFQSFENFQEDTVQDWVLGSIILEALGLSVSATVESNEKTQLIPENKEIPEREFMYQVEMYAKAYGTDPETAWEKMFKGQHIEKVEGGKIKVLRNDVAVSQAEKAKAGKANKHWKLDHTIPLGLAGDENQSNRKLIPTALHKSYTSTENALISAVERKKLRIKEAQKLITKFKSIEDKKERDAYGLELRSKYK